MPRPSAGGSTRGVATLAANVIASVNVQANTDFGLLTPGSGYAVGDILYVDNHADFGLGKDRIRVTVETVNATGGILTFSYVAPTDNVDRDDAIKGASEPTYALNKPLTATTVVGSGSAATFKISNAPTFRVSARKAHPFPPSLSVPPSSLQSCHIFSM